MRAVIDTNVMISGVLVRQGNPANIIRAMLDNQFTVVTSPSMLQELIRVSSYKRLNKYAGLSNAIEALVDFILAHASIVQGTPQEAVIAQDPDDDYVLACAREGEADYIVSGDRHLLDLGQYRGIPILTPAQFMEKLTEDSKLG